MKAAEVGTLGAIERAVAIVLRGLKRTFPDDYDRRCMYAAAGIKHLLSATGTDARIHAGDFLALVVSRDESRASMQGFRGSTGGEAFSHYWVETPRLLIDLGPHLLPRGSSFPAADMPIIAWDKTQPLPLAFRYRVLERYAPNAAMLLPTDIADRMGAFLADMELRSQQRSSIATAPTWLLTGEQSLQRAARRDEWARGALRFERVQSC